jgi:hypothetical protein
MYKHEIVRSLSSLYNSMPVSTDGYYLNISRSGCSITISPGTLDYTLQFLDCLVGEVERLMGNTEVVRYSWTRIYGR